MRDSSRLFTIAAYPRKLLQLCESRWQIAPATLLAASRLTSRQLERADQMVPLVDVYLIFQEALRRCPEPPLSLPYAETLAPGSHGLLGQATLTAPTLGHVLRLYYDYVAVVAPFVLVHHEQRRQLDMVVLEQLSELPLDEHFLMEVLVLAAWNILLPVVGGRIREVSLHLTEPPPAHAAALQQRCHGNVYFNASFNGLALPSELLNLPLATADAERHETTVSEIRLRMTQLLADGSLADSIRLRLADHPGPLPRMEEVAAALGLTVRTLRNRLSQQGTTFQALLEEARQSRAYALLRDSEASVKEIAYALGYRESSNFSRVFRSWTGVAPLTWRRQIRAAR